MFLEKELETITVIIFLTNSIKMLYSSLAFLLSRITFVSWYFCGRLLSSISNSRRTQLASGVGGRVQTVVSLNRTDSLHVKRRGKTKCWKRLKRPPPGRKRNWTFHVDIVIKWTVNKMVYKQLSLCSSTTHCEVCTGNTSVFVFSQPGEHCDVSAFARSVCACLSVCVSA